MNPAAYEQECGDPTDWSAGDGGGEAPPQQFECDFTGFSASPGRFTKVTGAFGAGAGFFNSIAINFSAVGGSGSYSWNTPTQSVTYNGSVTYQYGGTRGPTQNQNGTGPDTLLPNEFNPNGAAYTFTDTPGLFSPRPRNRMRPDLPWGNIISANIANTFVFQLSVTDAVTGQTAQCPTIDWMSVINWPAKGSPTGNAFMVQ